MYITYVCTNIVYNTLRRCSELQGEVSFTYSPFTIRMYNNVKSYANLYATLHRYFLLATFVQHCFRGYYSCRDGMYVGMLCS